MLTDGICRRLRPGLRPRAAAQARPNFKIISSHIDKNLLPWYNQPSVYLRAETHTLEVNSNTLGFCALHHPGAVCTKTANPETEASRCRRRAERTCLIPHSATNHTKTRL